MDSVGHLLIFLTPTHTHIFGNHNNGYGHSKIANVRSSADCRKTELSTIQTWTWFRNLARIMICKVSISVS
jgi:hypothetical protein